MSRRGVTLLILLGALVLVRLAVWFHQPARQVWPAAAKTVPPAPAAAVPVAVPAPAAADVPRPAPAPGRARKAIDRLLAALRSGDKAAVREALEAVRGELVPAPVPDGENAAVLYKKAFEAHRGETDDADVEILERLGEGKAITPDERNKLQAYLDNNREALALLHEAASRPRCNFGLDYSQGHAMELPHITPLILSARLLEVEAALAGEGRSSEIARASLRLSEAVADEPVLISQLVRTVLHSIGAEAGQKEFAGELAPERLQALLALSPERVREGYEKVLLFELYAGVQFVSDGGNLRDLQVEGVKLPGTTDPPTAQDLEHYVQTLSEYAALSGRPYYEIRDELERLRQVRVEAAPWYAELTRALLPSMTKALERQAYTEACVGTTQLAAALRTYRDAHGAYPPTLDPIREILPRMPVDPYTGKPYFYRREGSGFVVYSAAPSGIDVGGTALPGAEQSVLFRSPR